MARRMQMVLITLGMLLILCAFFALVYAFWPMPGLVEQTPLPPTVFSPP
jgi:hypothetical protein